ncbi:MAG: hypothetical protein ABIJ37_03055 [Pseudomonadota bacterium]
MSRIFIDGFEAGDLTLWDILAGTPTLTADTALDGEYYVDVNYHSGSDLMAAIVPADNEYYFALRIKINSVTSGRASFSWRKGSNAILQFALNGSGNYCVYRGTTLITTGSKIMDTEEYLIEGHIVIHDTTGVIQLKIDEVLDIDFSGDTKPGSDTTVDRFLLGRGTIGFESAAYFDNIIIDDADWIGDTSIQAITVTGAGTTTDWDPSTGSNYECVDEIPYSDTDYNNTNTTNEIDTFAMSNLTGNIDSVKCVQLQARVAYEGAPTPTHIQLGVRSGGTDYFATDKSPGVSFDVISKILETDPDTSSPWTESGINAMEVGYKATA